MTIGTLNLNWTAVASFRHGELETAVADDRYHGFVRAGDFCAERDRQRESERSIPGREHECARLVHRELLARDIAHHRHVPDSDAVTRNRTPHGIDVILSVMPPAGRKRFSFDCGDSFLRE